MRSRDWIGRVLICLFGLAVGGVAQEKKPEDKAKPPEAGAGQQMDEMMAAYMKLAEPGEHHAHLKPLAGTWEAVGRFRMMPDAPWEESKSESTAEWILGGRFLTQKIKGEPMAGMPTPFEGFGILGYDNQKKKYTSVWMDNMGTMTMTAEGTCDSGGKVISFKGSYADPMTGQESYMKSVYKIESDDKYVLSMSGPGPDGKEFMMMEIVHTRKK